MMIDLLPAIAEQTANKRCQEFIEISKLISYICNVIRKIISYKDNFVTFYRKQNEKIQEKIEYAFDLVRYEKQVPKKFFKYLENTNGIY